MDQPKIETLTEALTFDKRVMRELSRKDSLVRMFAKDQPLDILFTTLVVGDSGLESKYIEIAKSLGADVGVKESVDSLPQKWEISFCNLTEQHIARMGQQIHTENTNDIPHMTLPGSAVPIPISALHVDREAGKVSFRIHTVSERIARLVMDEMQKVLDGKTEGDPELQEEGWFSKKPVVYTGDIKTPKVNPKRFTAPAHKLSPQNEFGGLYGVLSMSLPWGEKKKTEIWDIIYQRVRDRYWTTAFQGKRNKQGDFRELIRDFLDSQYGASIGGDLLAAARFSEFMLYQTAQECSMRSWDAYWRNYLRYREWD